METLDKGMIDIPSGMEQTFWDVITLLRIVCNLNIWIVCFWNFSFNIFILQLSASNWNIRWGGDHYCTSEENWGHFQCIQAPDHFLEETEVKINSTTQTRHKSNYSLNTLNDFPPFSACVWNALQPVLLHLCESESYTDWTAIPFPVSMFSQLLSTPIVPMIVRYYLPQMASFVVSI